MNIGIKMKYTREEIDPAIALIIIMPPTSLPSAEYLEVIDEKRSAGIVKYPVIST
ncbi:hypothetical protein HS5_24690 [Acidianus sp. HS-5]|nr:hypothetical protein HS5_24690 [Acidianus sp. HS-5]